MPENHDPDSPVEIYAATVEALGPLWKKSANSIRAGYRNNWIEAALIAIAKTQK